MKNISMLILSCFLLIINVPSFSDDRVDHYKGKTAESLEQALMLLQQHNQELKQILAANELSAADINRIHQVTYTLENALEKMVGEIGRIKSTLENLHKASEGAASAKVKELGAQYLKQSMPLH